MADMTQQELQAAIDHSFESVADDVLTPEFINSLDGAQQPSDFWVPTDALGAAGATSVSSLAPNLKARMMTTASGIRADAFLSSAVSAPAIVDSAVQNVRDAAAAAVQQMVCGQLRQWFEANLEQVKAWYEESGLKGTLKKMLQIGKDLTTAAVTAIAGVVGSIFWAYALLGVAVAAVGVGIYFLIRAGVPNYCATPAS